MIIFVGYERGLGNQKHKEPFERWYKDSDFYFFCNSYLIMCGRLFKLNLKVNNFILQFSAVSLAPLKMIAVVQCSVLLFVAYYLSAT